MVDSPSIYFDSPDVFKPEERNKRENTVNVDMESKLN